MQRVIVSGGRRAVYEDLTPAEEAARLAESAQEEVRLTNEARKEVKRKLLMTLLEIREMRQNRDVYTDEDIAGKQAEIDGLRGKL